MKEVFLINWESLFLSVDTFYFQFLTTEGSWLFDIPNIFKTQSMQCFRLIERLL